MKQIEWGVGWKHRGLKRSSVTANVEQMSVFKLLWTNWRLWGQEFTVHRCSLACNLCRWNISDIPPSLSLLSCLSPLTCVIIVSCHNTVQVFIMLGCMTFWLSISNVDQKELFPIYARAVILTEVRKVLIYWFRLSHIPPPVSLTHKHHISFPFLFFLRSACPSLPCRCSPGCLLLYHLAFLRLFLSFSLLPTPTHVPTAAL